MLLITALLVTNAAALAPPLRTLLSRSAKPKAREEAITLILEATEKTGLQPGSDVKIALDAAATEFHSEGGYMLEGALKSADEMVEFYAKLCADYPIYSIEDGLEEDDWNGWKAMTEAIGDRVQLVGDDLFVTNPVRLERGISEGIANAILIKVNQIGTLTETLAAMEMASRAGFNSVVSVRPVSASKRSTTKSR